MTNQELKDWEKILKENGRWLYYLEEQTPELCLIAVKQDGKALEYVKEQTPEICLAAVKQNKNIVKYVKKEHMNVEILKIMSGIK